MFLFVLLWQEFLFLHHQLRLKLHALLLQYLEPHVSIEELFSISYSWLDLSLQVSRVGSGRCRCAHVRIRFGVAPARGSIFPFFYFNNV